MKMKFPITAALAALLLTGCAAEAKTQTIFNASDAVRYTTGGMTYSLPPSTELSTDSEGNVTYTYKEGDNVYSYKITHAEGDEGKALITALHDEYLEIKNSTVAQTSLTEITTIAGETINNGVLLEKRSDIGSPESTLVMFEQEYGFSMDEDYYTITYFTLTDTEPEKYAEDFLAEIEFQ